MEDGYVTCPFCAEPIRAAAILCRHCGSDVKAGARPARAAAPYRSLASQRDFADAVPGERAEGGLSVWSVLLVGAFVVGGILAFNVARDQGLFVSEDVTTAFVPAPPPMPQPEVVEHGSDDANTTLLDYRARVWGRVFNAGAAGNVAVEAELQQGPDSWTQVQRFYLQEGEERLVEFAFSEASLGRGGLHYVVRARAD